jgi:hypothetical protein
MPLEGSQVRAKPEVGDAEAEVGGVIEAENGTRERFLAAGEHVRGRGTAGEHPDSNPLSNAPCCFRQGRR